MRIIKNKSVEEFQPWPYVATMMNCMLWVFYGLPVVHKDSLLVTTINGVGMGFEAIYISIFLIYCGGTKNIRVYIYIIDPLDFDDIDRMFKKKIVRVCLCVQRKIGLYLVAEVIAVAGIVLITLFAIQNAFAKQTFVGVICDIFNIAMYGAPSLVIVSLSLSLSISR